MASKPSNPAKPAPAAQPAAKVDSKPVETAKPPVKGGDKPAAVAKKKTPARPRVANKASDEARTVVAKTAAPAAKAAAPAKQAIETAAKTVNSFSDKDLKMTNFEDTVTKSQALFGDVNERAKAQFDKNAKLVEELNSFAKGNVEAFVEAGKITAKGWEAVAQDAADFTRTSFEKATATMKQAASVKSPADLFKLHSDFVREQFDAAVAQTSKNTEALIKIAGDAAQPISSRYAVAMDKAKAAA